jgi:hypothetical protein
MVWNSHAKINNRITYEEIDPLHIHRQRNAASNHEKPLFRMTYFVHLSMPDVRFQKCVTPKSAILTKIGKSNFFISIVREMPLPIK